MPDSRVPKPWCRRAKWGQSLLTLPLLLIMMAAGSRLRLPGFPLLVLFSDDSRLRGMLTESGRRCTGNPPGIEGPTPILAPNPRPRVCVIASLGRNIYFKPLRILLLNCETFSAPLDASLLARYMEDACG